MESDHLLRDNTLDPLYGTESYRVDDIGVVESRLSRRRGTTVVIDRILKEDGRYEGKSGGVRRGGIARTGQTLGRSLSEHKDKSWLYRVFQSRSEATLARLYRWIISMLILANVVGFVLSTVPEFTMTWSSLYFKFEALSSTIFAVEFFARLWVIVEHEKYSDPVWGRLRYLTTMRAVIDALATFPFFIEQVSGRSLPTLTWVRLFRLVRILRGKRVGQALRSAYRVFYFNRHILGVSGVICFMLMFSTSLMLYYLQPDPTMNNSTDDFSSLPATMYMSLLMLAGQGGPSGPLPWYTKLVVLITSIFSVAMFAIPAGMLTWGFEAEAERLIRREYEKQQEPGITEECSISSSSSSWDEYAAVILGEDDDSDKERGVSSVRAEHEYMRTLIRRYFQRMNVDGS
mmetsp:Transcript_312/g.535  ORF Transcript_312/g.535 Transcript_312/m.535 type:complete len:402 (-) Transcript_312:624-1829(-)